MARTPSNLPPGAQGSQGADGPKYSGTQAGGDPTTQPGQYPPDRAALLFGGTLPTSTGAPGSQGATAAADATLEAGQLNEGLSGLGPADTADTGAPGSQGAQNTTSGSQQFNYTRPGSFISGTYQQDTVTGTTSGPSDDTQANDQGYASGGPQLPSIAGNEPDVNKGPYTAQSGGRVLRGGRGSR